VPKIPIVAAKLPRNQLHVWSPPGSPIRITYAAALFQEVRLEGVSGVLYGLRSEAWVRLVVACIRVDSGDLRQAGLYPVGIFSARNRGEVFLTETDLEQFERTGAPVALVIAGAKAGFFVHQHDGSIQSIKSHEEFAA